MEVIIGTSPEIIEQAQAIRFQVISVEQQGVESIEIHAHSYLRNYYEKFGFNFVQEVEIVGEHQLIEMRYQLARMFKTS